MVVELHLIDELSYCLGYDKKFLEELDSQNGNRDYYRKLYIKKKSGGTRLILAPSADLKLVQNYLKEKYLSQIKTHDSSTAYKRGKNILDNVKPHLYNKHFLFIDVQNFFESINYSLLLSKLKTYLHEILNEQDIEYLLNVCTRNKILVQGSVTSPMLSNIYLLDFDNEMELYAKQNNLCYTRYSDDITISSNSKINEETLFYIRNLLAKHKLDINIKKTHFSSYLENIKITGVRIKNDKSYTLPTKYKKKLKTSLYHLFNDKNNIEDPNKLLGALNYLKMIDQMYFNKMNIKYCSNGKTTTDRLKELINQKKSNSNVKDIFHLFS